MLFRTQRIAALAGLVSILSLCACKKEPPPDVVCSYEPLPATAEVPSGQGALQVMAATDTYFYAFDSAGKQIGSHGANGSLPLKPGDYQIKVNNSMHPVSVQSKSLTKCSTGAVQVTGKTDEYYYVFDGAGTQLASAHINAATSSTPQHRCFRRSIAFA